MTVVHKELENEKSKKLDWSGIEFPVAADANIISKFERNNVNVNINVLGYGNKIISPIMYRISGRFEHKISLNYCLFPTAKNDLIF